MVRIFQKSFYKVVRIASRLLTLLDSFHFSFGGLRRGPHLEFNWKKWKRVISCSEFYTMVGWTFMNKLKLNKIYIFSFNLARLTDLWVRNILHVAWRDLEVWRLHGARVGATFISWKGSFCSKEHVTWFFLVLNFFRLSDWRCVVSSRAKWDIK